VASLPIRIVSDVHFAEGVSRVRSLGALRPLTEGASMLVFNGDTMDTRPGRDDRRTARIRREVLEYFGACGTPVTFLTGNHDPDITRLHSLELASGRVLVTHGDVLFDNIVPWSNEAHIMRQKVIQALAALPGDGSSRLEGRLDAFRTAAASVRQRHQSEGDTLRYAIRLAGDTVWPPDRILKILRAWREAPGRAEAFAGKHRPRAAFVVIGHTHRPGVWRMPSGIIVVNTGSFCRPFGAMAAEVGAGTLAVRKVVARAGAFHPGPGVAKFPIP
jgi:predicted phosphodiesterase